MEVGQLSTHACWALAVVNPSGCSCQLSSHTQLSLRTGGLTQCIAGPWFHCFLKNLLWLAEVPHLSS